VGAGWRGILFQGPTALRAESEITSARTLVSGKARSLIQDFSDGKFVSFVRTTIFGS